MYLCVCVHVTFRILFKSQRPYGEKIFFPKREYMRKREKDERYLCQFFSVQNQYDRMNFYIYFFCSFIDFHSLLWPLTLSSLFENVDCM